MNALRSVLVEMTVLAVLGLSATAAVADGVYGAGPSYRELPSIWSGLYGGVHLGYADADFDDGVVGGVQLGYNW